MITLKGDNIVPEFIKILDEYVETRYGTAGSPKTSSAVPNKAEFATRA